MARKYRAPWWMHCRWSVEANTDTGTSGTRQGWKQVYCTKTKSQARADAKSWRERSGQDVRVVPGSGHKSRRT